MKKIESWIIEVLLKAKIGEIIGRLFSKLTGWKTYITLILLITLKFAIYVGFIPTIYMDIANEAVNALYGALTLSIGDKFKRYWEAIKKTGDDVVDKK
jgi:hypothetical protein